MTHPALTDRPPRRVPAARRRRTTRCSTPTGELRAALGATLGRVARRARARRADAPARRGGPPARRRRRHLQRLRRPAPAPHRPLAARSGAGACSASDEWADDRARRASSGPSCSTSCSPTSTGPATCSAGGVLPPELVFAHPGFLRACDQIRLPGAHAAVHTPRSTSPATPTDAASCSPTARRRRRARGTRSRTGSSSSRVFPSLYRDARGAPAGAVLPRAARARCRRSHPRAPTIPRIVVLTPGPCSETAFEHAYLASYLGYSLVEGADLTVRDGRVWLRSLGRLEPVDVILRRVDAVVLRPARAPARLAPRRARPRRGVPARHGLGRQHARQRRAREPRRCSPFLPAPRRAPARPAAAPAVGRHVVVRRRRRSRAHVLANLDQLVLKPIGRAGIGPTPRVRLGAVASAERDELRAPRSRPARSSWVGQEPSRSASAPTLTDDGLEARRPCCARSRSPAATPTPSMPGGLTRVAPAPARRPSSPTRPARSARTPGCSLRARDAHRASGCSAGPPSPPSSPRARCRRGPPRTCSGSAATPSGPRTSSACSAWSHDRRNEFEHGTNPAGTECLRVLLAALTARHHDLSRASSATARPSGSPTPGPELVALVVDEHRARHARLLPCAACSTPPTRCATSSRATPGWCVGTSTAILRPTRSARPPRGRRRARSGGS